MDADIILRRLVEARESWVEVAPGKRIRIRRPAEAEVQRFAEAEPLQRVRDFVVGWEGVTEADLFGAAVGADEPAPFSPALWAEVVADRIAWMAPVHEALVAAINAHRLSIDDAAKN